MLYVRRQWCNASLTIRLGAFGHVSHLQQTETREPQGDLCLLVLRRQGRVRNVHDLQRGKNRHLHTLRRGSCDILVRDRQFSPQEKIEATEAFDALDTFETPGPPETPAETGRFELIVVGAGRGLAPGLT